MTLAKSQKIKYVLLNLSMFSIFPYSSIVLILHIWKKSLSEQTTFNENYFSI